MIIFCELIFVSPYKHVITSGITKLYKQEEEEEKGRRVLIFDKQLKQVVANSTKNVSLLSIQEKNRENCLDVEKDDDVFLQLSLPVYC